MTAPKPLDYFHDQETRTTDEKTGGQKGVKLTQIGALDPLALIELGRVAGMGADKYEAFNYLRGFEWSKAFNAMQRHANLFWAGEDLDPESGLPHIAHAAWMALALLSFHLRGLGDDNRPPKLPVEGGLLPELERAERVRKRPVEGTLLPWTCSLCGETSNLNHPFDPLVHTCRGRRGPPQRHRFGRLPSSLADRIATLSRESRNRDIQITGTLHSPWRCPPEYNCPECS